MFSLSSFLVQCRLLQLQRTVISTDAELPDELLYGRAGYLYALLYLNTEIGPDTVPQSVVKEVRDFSLFSLTASVKLNWNHSFTLFKELREMLERDLELGTESYLSLQSLPSFPPAQLGLKTGWFRADARGQPWN